MSRARIYARNLFANWVGYGASLLVMFFMSPFVVHTLGDVDYGVWALMMSLTGYLGLVELGTRAGIGRFINYYLAKEDIPKVNGIISTGVAIFVVMGALLLIAGGTLAALMPWIFPKIPPELIPDARIICLLIAVNLWMSFLSAPFRQVIQAHERFELTNAVDLLVLALRTTATIFALLHGYRLITLALIQVAASIVGQVGVQLLARHVFPQLSVRSSLVSVVRFRELFGFSIWAFIGSMGGRLIFSASTLVIAIVLGPKWITYYAVGGMPLHKALVLVSSAAAIFSPGMMQDCARQDSESLRERYRQASNLSSGVGILLLVGMIVFGKEFIVLWMGPRFEISYTILAILASSLFVSVAISPNVAVYSGLHRIKLAATLKLLQGVCNFALALVFVLGLRMGIEGVAWGAFFPRIVFSCVNLAICLRLMKMGMADYVREMLFRWVTLAGVFWCACNLVQYIHMPIGWPSFFAKVSLVGLLYLPLAYQLLSLPHEKRRLRQALRSRITRLLRIVPAGIRQQTEE